jgi:hypothetical protein
MKKNNLVKHVCISVLAIVFMAGCGAKNSHQMMDASLSHLMVMKQLQVPGAKAAGNQGLCESNEQSGCMVVECSNAKVGGCNTLTSQNECTGYATQSCSNVCSSTSFDANFK